MGRAHCAVHMQCTHTCAAWKLKCRAVLPLLYCVVGHITSNPVFVVHCVIVIGWGVRRAKL